MKQLPSDEKLNVILEGMARLSNLNNRVENSEAYTMHNMATLDVVSERLRLLEYKGIDNDARQRETNLLFTGIPEKHGENCKQLVCDTICAELKLSVDDFFIIDAYRFGGYPQANHSSRRGPTPTRYRQIFVTFSSKFSVSTILRNTFHLKGSYIGISRDYPREIADARKALWPEFKDLKKTHGPRTVKILFPAKLTVNGTVHRDMFPDWHSVLSGSRSTNVNKRVTEAFNTRTADLRAMVSGYSHHSVHTVSPELPQHAVNIDTNGEHVTMDTNGEQPRTMYQLPSDKPVVDSAPLQSLAPPGTLSEDLVVYSATPQSLTPLATLSEDPVVGISTTSTADAAPMSAHEPTPVPNAHPVDHRPVVQVSTTEQMCAQPPAPPVEAAPVQHESVVDSG